MIEVRQLAKKYGAGDKTVHALKGITLTIDGGMFGLLGPNGAGKTTLMRILAGIVHATSGEVSVLDNDMSTENGRRSVKAVLGYLPQELGLYPDLTARQFIDYMAILKGVEPTKARSARVQQVLEMVSLQEVADRKIKGLSGGMKRRVGIGQALVNDPRILMVDEPTAGLDPEERIRFRNLLVDMATDRVVLLSTHIVGDIGQSCRQMAVLASGQIKYIGSPADLIGSAAGHVWTIDSATGEKPNGNLTVVSTLHLSDGVRYRVVGESASQYPQAVSVHPSLEDSYMWLMKPQPPDTWTGGG